MKAALIALAFALFVATTSAAVDLPGSDAHILQNLVTSEQLLISTVTPPYNYNENLTPNWSDCNIVDCTSVCGDEHVGGKCVNGNCVCY